APVVIYASWIGMLVVHEFGHIITAWLTGGGIIKVSLPLLGFSQTIVWPNPHELLVVWSGPVFGAGMPLIIGAMLKLVTRPMPDLWRFFTGFCLIANGAYIGAGAFIR